MSQPIKDTKASPGYIAGEAFFDGTLFRVNQTPGSETVELLHKSGSSIKFTQDGVISIIAAKDLHIEAGKQSGGSKSTIAITGELDIESTKHMHVKAARVDLDAGVAMRMAAKAVTMKSEKEYVIKAGDLTMDVANRTYMETNAFDTKYQSQNQAVSGPLVIENDTGIGFKMTNPKGGIWFESAGFMTVKCTQAYNTDVTLGNMVTNVNKGFYQVNVPANNIIMNGRRIYLN